MSMFMKLAVAVLFAVVGFLGLQAATEFTTSDPLSIVSSAEARVGRPLTPVSVAGVGRRTVRRCAVGVYHC